MLTAEQLKAWWRLQALPGMGLISLNKVRQALPSSKVLHLLTAQDLCDLGVKAASAQAWEHDPALNEGFAELQAFCQQPHCGVLLAGVAPYPESLAALPDAPILLYYRGNLSCLEKPMVAMVGSRNATPYALDWAVKTAADLAAADITVVSGLALGIDGAAHTGAVQTGSTIAVLGSGVDVIYPQRHRQLADNIYSQGLVLSEFPLGTAAQASHFPVRNRIVSGLSLAVVVVEAAKKSGTLITARLAADQGREVFALPGNVNNPLSVGCHELIRDGAILVRSSEDIIQDLGLQKGAQLTLLNFDREVTAAEQNPLLRHIDYVMTPVDAIALRTKMTMAELLPQLLELELGGCLQQVPGGYRRI